MNSLRVMVMVVSSHPVRSWKAGLLGALFRLGQKGLDFKGFALAWIAYQGPRPQFTG
jgi:hypothetical protein